ncbi:molybdenum cofactor biosynthesis protein B [bacterium]
MYTLGILTISDKGSQGDRTDESGKALKDIFTKNGCSLKHYEIIPDDKDLISKKLMNLTDELHLDLVLTTGGTGFSNRDNTPEATLEVIEKNAPGISEAIRAYSMTITKRAMLSRGISGIRKKTLIINLPGSPKAVKEISDFILDTVAHGLDILKGTASECARGEK